MTINGVSIVVQITPPLGIKILASRIQSAYVAIARGDGSLAVGAFEVRGQIVASGERLRSATRDPACELFLFQVDRVDMAFCMLSPFEHLPFPILVHAARKFAGVLVAFYDNLTSHARLADA